MDYVDTHCHLNFPQFHRDMEKTILRSFQAGLIYLINVGTDLKTSDECVNLASRYKEIYAAVGVHPHEARKNLEGVTSKLTQLLRHPKVVAIGEIGLDYYRNLSSQDYQKQVFKEQLNLALEAHKPVILHCRDAYRETLNILDEIYLPNLQGRCPGVIHSFSAGPNYLQEFLRRGFYIGLNAIITYPGNDSLEESVRLVPLNRILLETDAPYLPPVNMRGERNEPMRVTNVATHIALLKNIDVEEVITKTTVNALSVFGLQ